MVKGNKETGWRNCHNTAGKVIYFVDDPKFQIKKD